MFIHEFHKNNGMHLNSWIKAEFETVNRGLFQKILGKSPYLEAKSFPGAIKTDVDAEKETSRYRRSSFGPIRIGRSIDEKPGRFFGIKKKSKIKCSRAMRSIKSLRSHRPQRAPRFQCSAQFSETKRLVHCSVNPSEESPIKLETMQICKLRRCGAV